MGHKTPPWVQSLLLLALRRELKEKGITYRDLGSQLSLSEATIKRILKGKNVPLERLIRICRVLNLSLFELAARAHERHAEFHSLSEKQDAFFAKNTHFYWFLHRITRGVPLARLQEECDLDDRSVFKYLRTLEKLGLLELGKDNEFRLTLSGLPQWVSRGPMVKTHLMPQIEEFVTHLLRHENGDAKFLDVADRPMCMDTLLEMIAEMRAINAKYNRKSHQDAALRPKKDLFTARWAFALSAFEPDWKRLIPRL